MTNDRLILKALTLLIKRTDDIATGLQVYHDNESKLILDQIDATLDSVTADEMDQGK
jgi:hypothetical protein